MAIVTELKRITLDRASLHHDVECTYSIVNGDDGEKYLQVDTYGSANRRFPGKKSQSIRFAPEALNQLREILAREL